MGPVEFDLGFDILRLSWRNARSASTNGIGYWESAFRAVVPVGESIRSPPAYAYSPNVSNTGAWSQYAAAGLGFEVPARLLPQDISASVHDAPAIPGSATRRWRSVDFELPAYLNWQAGVTFRHKSLNFDLRYYDTNLSKENCFVFTGDPVRCPAGASIPSPTPMA